MKTETLLKIMLLVIYGCIIIFHIAVLIWYIPDNIAWGWRLETKEQMYVFEAISFIIISIVFIFFFINLGHLTKNVWITKFAKRSMWFFFIVFGLNTIGNIFAKTMIETVIATPITLAITILCWYLATKK